MTKKPGVKRRGILTIVQVLGSKFEVLGSRFEVPPEWPVFLQSVARMATAKHHEDLDVWKLSTELSNGVSKLIEQEKVKRDRSFCDQIQRSGRSAPANVAEGFARYRPREFARFVRIAMGSLGETQNHLREAQKKGYIGQDDFDRLWRLSRRAFGAAVKLHNYLKRCPERN